jgi:hypothetical protein
MFNVCLRACHHAGDEPPAATTRVSALLRHGLACALVAAFLLAYKATFTTCLAAWGNDKLLMEACLR